MITWDELPIEIQQKILYYQEKQGNSRNPNIFRHDIETGSIDGGFTWRDTEEGHNFWVNILYSREYNEFYELYPEKDISAKIDEILIKLENYDNLGRFTC